MNKNHFISASSQFILQTPASDQWLNGAHWLVRGGYEHIAATNRAMAGQVEGEKLYRVLAVILNY